jgi:hypothetical protein
LGAFGRRQAQVIVLGITPGVRSLAYCVLHIEEKRQPEVLDSDLLKGGQPGFEPSEAVLLQKSRPHALTLHIVIERAFDLSRKEPVIMALGPGTGKEPALHVLVVRLMLAGLAAELEEATPGLKIDCHTWETTDELDAILGMDVKKAVRRTLNHNGTTLIRSPYVLAAGTALAAAARIQDDLKQLRAHAR